MCDAMQHYIDLDKDTPICMEMTDVDIVSEIKSAKQTTDDNETTETRHCTSEQAMEACANLRCYLQNREHSDDMSLSLCKTL